MEKLEKKPGQPETSKSPETDAGPDMIRRDFIKRFGGYAAGTCAGLFVLMSPGTSTVQAGSDGGPLGYRR